MDIDFDSEGSKKDAIIEKLREKYGGYHHVTKVQTISTAKSKKALQIAARALGYSVEEGVFLGSFIGAERGTMYTLSQVYYGDEENGIQPNTEFVNLMNGQYNDVWKVAKEIEGLPVGVGSHAGGLILAVEDLTDNCALMKTRSGDIITQVDLHRAEDMRLIKYDCLNIDALEKIHIELDLLLEDGRIEWQGDLKSTYEKYLGTYNIERDNEKLWDLINEHKITSLFQFERQVGAQAITIGKPRNLVDLSALNSVMRLMAPYPRAETPLERFGRFNKDITLWYKEMEQYGLTKHEMEVVKKYAEDSHGVIPSQEGFMEAVQDPEIGGFDLLWADKLRKSIAKKDPKAYLELQQEFYKNIKEKKLSDKLCHYVWDVLISMNRGYGF